VQCNDEFEHATGSVTEGAFCPRLATLHRPGRGWNPVPGQWGPEAAAQAVWRHNPRAA